MHNIILIKDMNADNKYFYNYRTNKNRSGADFLKIESHQEDAENIAVK